MLFETRGDVEAAAVTVNFDSGLPSGKGIVLFKKQEDAIAAKREPPLAVDFGAPLIVTDFKIKIERGTGPPGPVVAEPVVAPASPRARDHLRMAIAGKVGLTRERIQQLVDLVGTLCIDNVYTLLQSPIKLDEWIARQPG
jgi:hypothetical protein